MRWQNGLTSTGHALIGSARFVGAEPGQPGLAEAVQMRVLVTHWSFGSSPMPLSVGRSIAIRRAIDEEGLRLLRQLAVIPFDAPRKCRNH
jgi:hypothetical protein